MLRVQRVCSAILVVVASARHADSSASHLVLLQQRAAREDQHGGSYGVGSTAPITERGYQTVAALNSDEEMRSFVYRVVESEARYVKNPGDLSGLVPFYSGTHSVQSLDALKKEIRSVEWVAVGEGRNAPLNEEGYQKVAARRSKHHMMAFARRILDADRRKCTDEGGLIGMMPYFDGEVGVQTFEQLRREVLSAVWAAPRSEVEATHYIETRKSSEDPEVVETTLATTTLATTLATTTLATTLATTTLATTLATTTLATTLATTMATTTEAVEAEEALQRPGEAKLVEHGSFVRESAENQGRWSPIAWLSKKFHGSGAKTDKTDELLHGHGKNMQKEAKANRTSTNMSLL